MTGASRVVASLKAIYGGKWRQGLLVNILIGIGRSLTTRSQVPSALLCQEESARDEDPDDYDCDGAVEALHQNPLGYVRQLNGKLARELETQIGAIRKGPVKGDSTHVYPDPGELMEAIGVQARMRLEGSGNDELVALLESVIQIAWEDAPLGVREDMLRILGLLSFFSASIIQ